MTITAPSPLVRLDAPLPSPRRYTLLDAADTPASAERWQGGARVNAYPAASVSVHDPCSTGTGRVKPIDAEHAVEEFQSFVAFLGGSCTGRSIGNDTGWYEERLLAAFQAVEATAVERVLATGDGQFDRFLGDGDMEVLGSGAVPPTEGLALLEDRIASVGNGIIHVAPATATYWAAATLIAPTRDGQMRTQIGTLVAVGAGYRGAVPEDESNPAADSEWAFASGPVTVYREPAPEIVPGDYSQAFDRTANEVTLLAERNYLLAWVGRQDGSDENHIQAGVLIDRIA